MNNAPLLETIQSKIDASKIVSFDIFDTMLLRPYYKPTDLFAHLEWLFCVPFFQTVRIKAEKQAREKHPELEDITIDDIYAEIDKVFLPFKEKELELEKQILQANPEIKQVYEYAKKQGKRIIIVSDMYMYAPFIHDILSKNGYSDYERLYLSSEIQKSKHTGNLYEYILSDLNVFPSDILHIGDNKHADYKKARERGINAVLYTQVVTQYLNANSRAKNFIDSSCRWFGASILVSVMARRWQNAKLGSIKSDYWHQLGYEYAGPLCYGFNRFVESEARKKGINELLFVARDGWTLEKVFKTFNSEIQTHYVYAPRFLNLICRLDYQVFSEQPKMIVDHFQEKNENLKALVEKTNFNHVLPHDFIKNNLDTFKQLSGMEYKNYQKYLMEKIKTSGTIGMVDLITGAFSSQKLLQDTLKNQCIIHGFYWGIVTTLSNGMIQCSTFASDGCDDVNTARDDIFTKNWNFLEFLITSPEYPIKCMSADGMPIYDQNPSTYEKMRSDIYPLISEGAVEFAEDVKNIFGEKDIFLSASVLIKWVNVFIDKPTYLDIKNMSNMWFACEGDHKEYIPLFSYPISLKEMILHPQKSIKISKILLWRGWLQSLIVCIADPIKFHNKGIKSLEICLFHKLCRRYFTIAFKFTSKVHYRLIIGNNKKE